MSNDLVPVDAWALADMGSDASSGVPAIGDAMRRMVEMFNERGRLYRLPEVSLELREEAQRLLPLVRLAAMRKPEAAIRSWLAPINAAVAKPLQMNDFKLKAEAIGEALSDLPAACFTREMRGLVLRDVTWWPSSGEIRQRLLPRADAVLGTLRALEVFARPAPRPAATIAHDKGTRPESQGERDRIVDRFHAQMREAGTGAMLERKDVARPRHEGSPGSGFVSADVLFDPARTLGPRRPAGTK